MAISIHSHKFSLEEEARYAALADNAVARGDVLILNGHNCGLRVMDKALHVKQGSLLGVDRKPAVYYKGMFPFRIVVILSPSGLLSIESLHWLREQNVSLVFIDGWGNLLYSIYPDNDSNAKLRRLQYEANYTGMSGYIARELVRMKTLSQIDMLREMPSHPVIPGSVLVMNGQKVTIKRKGETVYGEYIWEDHERGLQELAKMKEVNLIRLLEARLANKYWFYLVGLPITWESKSEKKVPPHWRCVTDRMNTASNDSTPRKAINPFHAALNYLYGVAEHILLCAIHSAGLDPACGFLHLDRGGRSSLVYDLIEPHRAEIDAKVLDFFSRTKLRAGDVTLLPEGHITLNREFCRYLIVSCLPDSERFVGTVSWLVNTLSQ